MKESESVSHSVMFDSCDPMDCSPPGSSVRGFSRQEYWSGLPFPSPGDLPKPWIEHSSPTLQADSLPTEPPGKQLNNSNEYILYILKVNNLITLQNNNGSLDYKLCKRKL